MRKHFQRFIFPVLFFLLLNLSLTGCVRLAKEKLSSEPVRVDKKIDDQHITGKKPVLRLLIEPSSIESPFLVIETRQMVSGGLLEREVYKKYTRQDSPSWSPLLIPAAAAPLAIWPFSFLGGVMGLLSGDVELPVEMIVGPLYYGGSWLVGIHPCSMKSGCKWKEAGEIPKEWTATTSEGFTDEKILPQAKVELAVGRFFKSKYRTDQKGQLRLDTLKIIGSLLSKMPRKPARLEFSFTSVIGSEADHLQVYLKPPLLDQLWGRAQAQAFNNAGVALLKANRFSEALKKFQSAVTADPAFVPAHCGKGSAYEKLGRYRPALDSYMKCMSLFQQSEKIRERIFQVVRKMSRPPEIPEVARRHIIRGQVLIQEKDWNGAKGEFRKAIELAPWVAMPYFNLAQVCGRLEQYGAAISYMKLYLQAAPHASDTRSAKDKITEWEIKLERKKQPKSQKSERLRGRFRDRK